MIITMRDGHSPLLHLHTLSVTLLLPLLDSAVLLVEVLLA